MVSTDNIPPALEELTERFARFPGVGRKSALRMAMAVLREPRDMAVALAKALLKVKDDIKSCSVCGNISQEDPCYICGDSKRDHSIICVVEQSGDIMSIEKGGIYRGVYHVLGGAISPLDGIGPDKLSFARLTERTAVDKVKEVIIATNPNMEGEATAMYIARQLEGRDIRVTRLARGLPVGGDLEYADEVTLSRALAGRQSIG